MNRIGSAIDAMLDRTVVPGYTWIGYRLRERLVPRGPLELAGRSVMVTGASSGIGEAACAELARRGAEVHMVVRNPDKGEAARERIEADSGSRAYLHICDVSDLASVRAFAAAFEGDPGRLDVLVNNAGILPPERSHTDEGVETAFATNLLGPFLLTELLLPTLRASDSPRVVNASSGGMYTRGFDFDDPQLEHGEYSGAKAYAQTKRGEVLLTEAWAEREAASGGLVRFHSYHPGWVETPGVSGSLPAFERVMKPLLRNPREGADTIVWLAGSAEGGSSTGCFWHDRRPRPTHRVPWTRQSPDAPARLFELCEHLCAQASGGSPD